MSNKAAAISTQSGRTTILMGGAGIGKTTIFEQFFARFRGYHMEVMPVAVMEHSDVGGMPFLSKEDVMCMSKPYWLQALWSAHDEGLIPVIFWDELTTAAPSIMAAALGVMQSYRAGAHPLPPNTLQMATANPPEIAANGTELPAPLANRMIHIQGENNVDTWVNGMINGFKAIEFPTLPKNWRENYLPQARIDIASYIKARPEQLYKFPDKESARSGPWPSNRSWDNASVVLAASRSINDEDDTGFEMVCGAVGNGSGAELMQYISEQDLRTPQEILKLGKKYTLPARGDQQFAELNSVTRHVVSNTTPEAFASIWDVLEASATGGAADVAAGCMPALINEIWMPKQASYAKDYKIPPAALKAFGPILRESGILK
jgi:hypothetical protein